MKRSLALLILPALTAAVGLKVRHAAEPDTAPAEPDTAPAPAPAPGASPAPAPLPAPAPIRPGIVVRITGSKEQLTKSFEGQVMRYNPLMDEMLGKDFVVKEMLYGGAGLSSPNGSQGDTWYFPLTALTPWTATKAAQEPPVASKAGKVMGLPTRAKVEIGPPGRHDAPWDFTIKGRNLMDPIAPSYNERVDLEKTSMPLPPWMKVKQVVSIECMEKLHKDPSHLCDPEAYTNYNAVTAAPTTEKPLTKAEAKKLKDKIRRLKSTIKTLSPKKEVTKETLTFKAPSMRDMVGSRTRWPWGVRDPDAQGTVDDEEQKSANKKMKIGKAGSDEKKIEVHYSEDA